MFSNINKIIFKIIAAFLSISFFIGGHIITYAIFIFVLGILFYSAKLKELNFKFNKSLLAIIAFYLIHVIGILYSTNKSIANFDIEVKASIIIFPLLFSFTSNIVNTFKKTFFNFFVISSSLYSLILITRAFFLYFETRKAANLFYESFSFNLHPSYLSVYLITAIIIAVFILKKQKTNVYKIYIYVGIFLNSLALFFANSKAGYISAIIVFSITSLLYLYKYSRKLTAVFIILSIIFVSVLFKTNVRFQVMFKIVSLYQHILDNPNTYKEGTGLRILSWNAAINVIKENPIIGVGTGDIKPELFKKYKELDYQKNLKIKMNVHNQFLETWLGQGIIGFVLLLLVFIIPFIDAIKRKNILLQSFLLLMFINFLFESMLNTQAGTIFFGFFYPLLVITDD